MGTLNEGQGTNIASSIGDESIISCGVARIWGNCQCDNRDEC